jgi:hypothetical protein
MVRKLKKFKPNSQYSSKIMIIWVATFAAIGVTTLLLTRAATPLLSTEGKDTSCNFQKADAPVQVAFCDGFNTAYLNDPSVNRSGDLNNQLWGVSRTNTNTNTSQGQLNTWNPTQVLGCGADTSTILPTKDVRICNGRLYEGVTDGGGQSTLAIYPKQPFDIKGGRTGTVSFDVSSDSQGPHAAWPEFWWTDQPVPAPVDHRSAQVAHPRNGIGIHFAVGCGPDGYGTVQGVDTISITRNYVLQNYGTGDYGGDCNFKVGHATGDLNHVEIRISTNEIQVWVSNPTNTPATAPLQLVADLKNANITMTKGLTWMLDAHYNGNKFDTQGTHTFAWDNFGFDGPDTYRDLAFDVPDNTLPGDSGSVNLGYELKKSENLGLSVKGVYRLQTPTGGLVTFNFFPWDTTVPSFRIINSAGTGPWHDTTWPFDDQTYAWRTMGVAVPTAEIQDGTNTIEFKNTGTDPNTFNSEVISNIDLILVAGASVPGSTITPPVTPTSPIVSLTSPVANSTIGGTTSVLADASDDIAITKVEFYSDNNFIGSSISAPYSVSLDTSKQPNGTHILTAKAYNTAGLSTTSIGVAVTINNAPSSSTAPSVSISLPVGGTTVSTPVAIQATAADVIGISKVEFFLDGTLLGTDTASPYSFTLNPALYTNGLHNLSAKAYDNGNPTILTTVSSTVSITIANLDTTPPSIIINTPRDGSSISGSSINVSTTVSDIGGVARVEFSIDSGPILSTETAVPYNYNVDTTKLSNGSHTVLIKAYDNSNNAASSSVTVTIAHTGGALINCDFDNSGHVDLRDLVTLLTHYGKQVLAKTNGDCNGDGVVDLKDLILLLGAYGK